ncbi:MAG: hypothetical protein ABI743_14915, partial [bacterium]
EVATTTLPVGFGLEPGPNSVLPIGMQIVSTIVRALPVGVRIANGPGGSMPLGVDLLGPPAIHSLPVGVWLRNGGRMPVEGLLIDPVLHDLLPLTTPVQRAMEITLSGETPLGLDPLPS